MFCVATIATWAVLTNAQFTQILQPPGAQCVNDQLYCSELARIANKLTNAQPTDQSYAICKPRPVPFWDNP